MGIHFIMCWLSEVHLLLFFFYIKIGNITSVFTYRFVGEQLARIVDIEKVKLNVYITPGKYGKPPNINRYESTKWNWIFFYHSLKFYNFPFIFRTSVLFVSISFIVLMIISFVWLVFYYVQRFRYLQTKDRKSVSLNDGKVWFLGFFEWKKNVKNFSANFAPWRSVWSPKSRRRASNQMTQTTVTTIAVPFASNHTRQPTWFEYFHASK